MLDVEFIRFTLDTNCIIAIENGEDAASHLKSLLLAHNANRCDVAIVSVSASERQRGDSFMTSYSEFSERAERAGLGHLEVLQTIAYWNIGFYGMGIWGDAPMVDRERLIHETLFPGIPFEWQAFAQSRGLNVNQTAAPAAKVWRNAFCDRQMFWAHDHYGRDVFVTSDRNSGRKLSNVPEFSSSQVLTPAEAAELL